MERMWAKRNFPINSQEAAQIFYDRRRSFGEEKSEARFPGGIFFAD
jgi:hypothetical protein